LSWETDILQGLKAPTSANNISKLDAWNRCEGNEAGRSGLPINNPFNTTLNYGGGINVNSAGVKAYSSWSIGLQATLITLQSSLYAQIVNNLRQDGPFQAFAGTVGASPWGTSGTCIASVSPNAGPAGQPSSASSTVQGGSVNYNYAQLEGIWIQAGGNPQAAPMAAAIAMAESGGNSAAQDLDSNGTVDRGLWQINSVHGAQSTFDVMGNARAAVAISNNGSDWSAWVTYQTGAYQRYLQSNVPPDTTAPINGTSAAAGTGNQTATLESCGTWEWILSPGACAVGGIDQASPGGIAEGIVKGLIGGLINPFIQIVAGVMGITGGVIIMIGGMFLIVKNTQAYQETKSQVQDTSSSLAWLAGPEAGAAVNTANQAKQQRQPSPRQQQQSTTDQIRAEAARYRGYAQAVDAYRKTQAR
jgi:phage protein U